MSKEITKKLESFHFSHIQYNEKTDTYAALMPLAYTVAIAFDISHNGFFEERYCYEDPTLALTELLSWGERGLNEQRPVGWIACRLLHRKNLKESFEKFYGKDYAHEAKNIYEKIKASNAQGFTPDDWIYPHIPSDLNTAKHLMAYLRTTNQIE